MTLRLFIVAVSFFAVANTPPTADCINWGTFCETIVDEQGSLRTSLLIVRGTVILTSDDVVHVRLSDILHGQTSTPIIQIHTHYLGQHLRIFRVGREYILALLPLHLKDGYALISCGTSVLSIQNNMITGRIAPGITSLDLRHGALLEGCGGFSFDGIAFSVFPTFTQHQVNVVSNRDLAYLQITVFDIAGRLVYRHEGPALQGEGHQISAGDFGPGSYVVVCNTLTGRHVTKVVVV